MSKRRIFQDVAVLNSAGCRIAGDRKGYRLLNPNLQLPVTMSVPEIISLLGPGRGGRDFRESAQVKLSAALPKPLRELYRSVGRVSARLALSSAPESIGVVLDGAIAESRRLRITYRGNKDAAGNQREIDPYGTFVKGTGWYLVAWCHQAGKYKTYRTDRITDAFSTGRSFHPRTDFRLADYAEDSPGVWTPVALDARVEVLPSHVVTLRSEARALGFVFQPKGNGGLLEIARGNLDETAWWLARFGEGVCVVAPARLRDRLIKIARTILVLHGMNERVQPSHG